MHSAHAMITQASELSTMDHSIIVKFLLVAQLVLSISRISQNQYCGRVQQKNTSVKTIKFLLMVPYADPLNRSSFAFYYDFHSKTGASAYDILQYINFIHFVPIELGNSIRAW